MAFAHRHTKLSLVTQSTNNTFNFFTKLHDQCFANIHLLILKAKTVRLKMATHKTNCQLPDTSNVYHLNHYYQIISDPYELIVHLIIDGKSIFDAIAFNGIKTYICRIGHIYYGKSIYSTPSYHIETIGNSPPQEDELRTPKYLRHFTHKHTHETTHNVCDDCLTVLECKK